MSVVASKRWLGDASRQKRQSASSASAKERTLPPVKVRRRLAAPVWE
jgi:hypothetical protein